MRRKLIITVSEWLVVIVLAALFFWIDNKGLGSYSADSAHELSERSYHYGPSTVVKKVPVGNNAIVYLGTYKNWFSADTVVREHWKWYPGGGVAGLEIDRTKPISYSWEISQEGTNGGLTKFYGYVTDPDIATVVLHLEPKDIDGEDKGRPVSMDQSIAADRMFLFVWKTKGHEYAWKSLQGLDRQGKVKYEKKLE